MSSLRFRDEEIVHEGPKKRGGKSSLGSKTKSTGSVNAASCVPNTAAASRMKRTPKEAQYSFYSTDSENDVAKAHKDLDRCAKILSDLMPKERSCPRGTRPAERRKKMVSKSIRDKENTKDIHMGKQTNRVVVQEVVTAKSVLTNIEAMTNNHPAFNQRLPTSTPDRKDPSYNQLNGSDDHFLHLDSQLTCKNTSENKPTSTLAPGDNSAPLNPERFRAMADQYFKDKFDIHNSSQFELMMQEYFKSKLMSQYNQQSTPAPEEHPVRDTDEPLPRSTNERSYSRQAEYDASEIADAFENEDRCEKTARFEERVSDVAKPAPDTSFADDEEGDADTTLCSENVDSVSLANKNDPSCFDDNSYSNSGGKSLAEVRGQYHTLKYLIQELRASVSKPGADADVNQLIREIENTAALLSPVRNAIDFQSEIENALQPLQTENGQLRRRLRIVNQQLKDIECINQSGCDPSVELVQVQSENANLKQQLQEEKAKYQELSNQMYVVEKTIEKLTSERQHLLLLLNQKDTDHMKTRHDWVQEVTRLKKELEVAYNSNKMQRVKLETAEREGHILKTSITQRDVELSRLQELLMSFKGRFGGANSPDNVQQKHQLENKPPVPGLLTEEALEEFNRNTNTSKKSIHSNSPIFNAAEYFQSMQEKTLPPPAVRNRDVTSPLRELPSRVDAVNTKISPSARYKQTIIDLKMKAAMFNEKRETKSLRSKSSASDSGTEISADRYDDDGMRVSSPNPDASRASGNSCRYSVTDYFRKYPVDRFPNGGGDDLDETRIGAETTLDDESMISDLTVTSVSTIRSSDDRSFRENLDSLDANISRIQQTLIRK